MSQFATHTSGRTSLSFDAIVRVRKSEEQHLAEDEWPAIVRVGSKCVRGESERADRWREREKAKEGEQGRGEEGQ